MSKQRSKTESPGRLVEPTEAERKAAQEALHAARQRPTPLEPAAAPVAAEPDAASTSAPVAGPCCRVCRFWDARRGAADGLCRKNPPTVIVAVSRGVWPKTKPDDWCGVVMDLASEPRETSNARASDAVAG